MRKILGNKKIIILGILLIIFLVNFELSKNLVEYLTAYLANINIDIVTIIPYEYIGEILKLTFMSFLVVCFPIVLFLLYKHFQDALFEKEKKIVKYIPMIMMVAAIGLAIGLGLSLKIFLPYLSAYQESSGILNMRTLHSIVNFVIWISAGFAILSQLPFLVAGLVKSKIVSIDWFASKRKIVFAFLLVLSAIISPPDPLSLVIMVIPTYLLYEVSLRWIKKINL